MAYKMNNHGQATFFKLMLGITLIVLALALAGPVKNIVDDTRNETNEFGPGLNCSNTVISNYDKATCVVADTSIFYFVGGLIFIAGAIITAKVVFR